jgi:hypothetical protein
MRVEFEGSLSPAADLLAFAFALGVTAALSLSLGQIVEEHPEESDPISWEDLEGLRSWPGFDPDGDGLLQNVKVSDLDLHKSPPVIGLEGKVVVELSSDLINASYIFEEGCFKGPSGPIAPASPVHGIAVITEEGGRTAPGELRAFLWGAGP